MAERIYTRAERGRLEDAVKTIARKLLSKCKRVLG